MKLTSLTVLLAATVLTACSTTPTHEQMGKLPIVTYGDPVPEHQEFILHFPARKSITTEVSIGGSLLHDSAAERLSVSLKKDIYAYKQWVSYDMKTWHKGNETLGVNFAIRVPGPLWPRPGKITVRVEEKKIQP